ncbi:MAG: hypothetical protein H6708_26370 [Kofleriaceae bacterium]|nr:hypothetical protein [Myxococcales bacterium]MCB9563937.1 hypothetical protein [Kofleriaceae bacterium]
MKYAIRTSLVLFATGAAAALAGGCLDLIGAPDAPVQCEQTSDCNESRGEVCDEGVCWGDPPQADLAAILGPPAGRGDLAPTELTRIDVRDDGWMNELALEAPVTLHGRIEAECGQCPGGLTIAATIQVRRVSSIAGGPDYLATTQSSASAGDGGDSFTIALPPLDSGDAPYQLTIVPSDQTPIVAGGPTPAELVPPLRREVGRNDLGDALTTLLTGDGLRAIHGKVVDATGQGIAGMKVAALGRFDPLRPLERVSTIAISGDDGGFVLVLGADALDVFDVVATPPAGQVMPTLVAHDRTSLESDLGELHMPTFPAPTHITVPVYASDTTGSAVPVADARVKLTTYLADPIDPFSNVEAIYTVDTYTDASGNIEADVLPGAQTASRSYQVRVTPPADTPAASVWSAALSVGTTGGVVGRIDLGARSVVTGVLRDETGAPAAGVTVTAKPSLAFKWSLDSDTLRILSELDAPTAVTQPDGSFVLWLDPTIAGLAATYDLDCAPPELALIPRWTISNVDGAAPGTDLEDRWAPAAAYVRGLMQAPDGSPVVGAEARVYALGDQSLCSAAEAPANCVAPATFLGSGRSDDSGVVRLVLPR